MDSKTKIYERSITSTTHTDWKKLNSERKAQKRKWKEEELLATIEKQKKKEKADVKITEEKKIEQEIKSTQGRPYTVSIALPGSILDNAQTPELRSYLAGQIARAAVVFNVDEIIIFDETASVAKSETGEIEAVNKKGHANIQMARILQYLECPQYLRKNFFPQHSDLKYAGLLNPLDCPHHMRAEDERLYREGVVLQKPAKEGKGSYVNIGVYKEAQIDRLLQPGIRVTVKLDNPAASVQDEKKIRGKVVSPSTPRTDHGIYWGYSVRIANSLGSVFTESPYKSGYDLTIGTSDKGEYVDTFTMPQFRHLLVVFGGLQGLEASLDADEDLKVDDPMLLFHHYLNVCPNQGSRTIRTEEAILIAMSSLRPKIVESNVK